MASWICSTPGVLASLARKFRVPMMAALTACGSRGCPLVVSMKANAVCRYRPSLVACSRWLAGQSGAGGHDVAMVPVSHWAMQLAHGNPIDPAGGCCAATKG